MPSFAALLAERGVLLADGATGTNYQNMNMAPGVAPEQWVIDAPDLVSELHRRFLDAGSDLVLTCSFGASTPRLAKGPLAGRASELNRRAAEIAREAVGDEHLVDVHVGHLRRKLGDDPSTPRYVRTVRGIGYGMGEGR